MATKLILVLLIIFATTVSGRPREPRLISTRSFSLLPTRNPSNPRNRNPNPRNPRNPNYEEFIIMNLRPSRRFFLHHLRFSSHTPRFTQLPLGFNSRPKLPLGFMRRSEMTELPLGFKDRLFQKTELTAMPSGWVSSRFYPRSEMTKLPLGFNPRSEMTELPLGFKDRLIRKSEMTEMPSGWVSSSVVDRMSMDILSVVGSLLFGAACGALTAATMYLVWSLVNFRHGPAGFRSVVVDDDDEDDVLFNPKKPKLGEYVAVPDADHLKKNADAAVDVKETV